jgi:hypothetical protein
MAYRHRGWAFVSSKSIEQCVDEGVDEETIIHSGEGCHAYGYVEVNKVAGNFHFAPGKSFSQGTTPCFCSLHARAPLSSFVHLPMSFLQRCTAHKIAAPTSCTHLTSLRQHACSRSTAGSRARNQHFARHQAPQLWRAFSWNHEPARRVKKGLLGGRRRVSILCQDRANHIRVPWRPENSELESVRSSFFSCHDRVAFV